MTQNPSNISNNTNIAGLTRRLAAIFYDFLLLLSVVLSTAIIIPAIMTFSGVQATIEEGQTVHEIEPFIDASFFQIYFVFITCIFYCGFWKKNGQTLGMQTWRLKLIDQQGSPLTFNQCFLRWFTAGLSLGCAGLGYLWAIIDKEGLTWHDRLSKTRVILLPKPK